MSITEPAARRRLSHAYILSAPHREECLDMARSLAADIMCSAGKGQACGVCRDCRKISQGIHPDLVYVHRLTDDKGKQRKELVVDQIRALVADSQILPNEAERKVYVIDEAHLMNIAAQNAALKLLEEPPPRLSIILCATNAQSLLPTVRSRCAHIQSAKGQSTAEEESVPPALEYLAAVGSGDRWRLCSFCFADEGMDRNACIAFIQALESCSVDMICARRDRGSLTEPQLRDICRLCQRCREYLKVNTGVKHIFGLLAVSTAGEG